MAGGAALRRYNRVMTSKTLIAAIVVALTAAAALAQSSSEFGSVSGGQIELLTKGARKTSGSLGLTSGSREGYEATFGGTMLEDRLWFFGSASMLSEMPQRPAVANVDLKMDAQLGPRNSLAGAFSEERALPSSFLSLRYTGVVSNNLFFNATIMRRSN